MAVSPTGKSAKKTDQMRALDVRILSRQGLLKPGVRSTITWRGKAGAVPLHIDGDGHSILVTFPMRPSSGEEDEEWLISRISLASTPCRYGGTRFWWLCPSCSKRVAILYGPPRIACRRCHGLTYRSQAESAGLRAVRRANKLRKLLGWTPGIMNGFEPRRAGMHTRTFNKLALEYADVSAAAFEYLSSRYALPKQSLLLARSLQTRQSRAG